MSIYDNSRIILATKHGKENAIQKPFEDAFHAKIIVPQDYDTDQFGTFTGEIERRDTPYNTVIKKAKQAALHYNADYAIANEGTFGPHASYFFLPSDVELMSFVDIKNNIVVVESEITTETNYAHKDITISDDYEDFLEKIDFGSHGLIVRNIENHQVVAKGIVSRDDLSTILATTFQHCKKIRLQTDMRAMMNPTRMNVIHKLTHKLIQRLQTLCIKCQAPGFGKVSTTGKLRCKDCHAETELYQYKVLSCVKCDHEEQQPRSDGLVYADPQYCPYCNP